MNDILDNIEVFYFFGFLRQENYFAFYLNRLSYRDIIDNLIVYFDISSMQCGESFSQKRRFFQRVLQEEYYFCLKKFSLDTFSFFDEFFKKYSFIFQGCNVI